MKPASRITVLAALALLSSHVAGLSPTRMRAETALPPVAPAADESAVPAREALRSDAFGPDAVLSVIPFTTRYNTTLRGSMSFIGNTSMTCSASATCTGAQNATNNSLNDTLFMVHVDIDGNSATFNSSSASLSVPVGAQVVYARLYWGGNAVLGTGTGATAPPNIALSTTVRLATPASGYVTVTGTLLGVNNTTGQSNIYSVYSDVTSLVQTGGSGFYTVGNIQAGTGVRNDAGQSGGLFAGWSLVVVYKDPSNPLRSVTLWDGFGRIEPNTQGEATINGFVTPPIGPVTATVGVVAWEGDFGLLGDHFQVGGQDVSDGLNPANNFFNGSVSTYATQNARTPSYANQLGIDVDELNVSSRITNGQKVATITMPTAGDNYYAGVVGLMIDVYEPDVHMTKSATDVNGGALNPNDLLRWTLVMTNTGIDTATNVILRDVVPAGTTYVSNTLRILVDPNGQTGAKTDAAGDDSAEYDVATNRVIFRLGLNANATNGGKLAPGAVAKVQFDTRVGPHAPPIVDDGSVLTNTGVTNYNGDTLGEGFILTATATTTVTVVVPDAAVVKTDAGAIAAPGDTVQYTVTASNASDVSVLTGVVLTETLPAHTTFGGSPGWTQVGATNQYVYSVGTLAAGASVNVPFAVRLADNVPFTLSFLSNIVVIGDSGASGPDDNPGNNVFTETTPVIFANLLITKIVNEPVAVAGGQLNYTVRVTNTGPAIARNVTMRDILPPEVTYANHGQSQGSFNPAANVWTVGSLAVNASAQITLLVSVGSAVPPGTLIVNTAAVTSTTVPFPPPPAVVTTPVTGIADLAVSKDDGVSFVNVNQVTTYTIVVRNLGPSDAVGASVSDALPPGLVTATWTCAPAAGSACFPASGTGGINAMVNVAAGSRVTFTHVARVGPCDTNIVVNTVKVTPPSNVTDLNPGNNSASDTDSIGPGANVGLSQRMPSGALVPSSPGSPLTFVVEVINYGPDPATTARVIDNLPPSVSYVSSSATKGSFNPGTGIWTIGTLGVGQMATLTLNTTAGGLLANGTEVSNVATFLTSSPGNAPLGAVVTTFLGNINYAYLPVVFRLDAVSMECDCR